MTTVAMGLRLRFGGWNYERGFRAADIFEAVVSADGDCVFP